MSRTSTPLPRPLKLLRQAVRATEVSGDWRGYRQAQAARRAARVAARLSSLVAQLPRGVRLKPIPTARYPEMVRVCTPGAQSLDWDPTHNTVWSSGRPYKLDPAAVARIMAGLIADEREGVGG